MVWFLYGLLIIVTAALLWVGGKYVALVESFEALAEAWEDADELATNYRARAMVAERESADAYANLETILKGP